MDSMVSTHILFLIIHPKKEFQQGHTGLTLIEHGYFGPLAFGSAQDTAIFMSKISRVYPAQKQPPRKGCDLSVMLSPCSSILSFFHHLHQVTTHVDPACVNEIQCSSGNFTSISVSTQFAASKWGFCEVSIYVLLKKTSEHEEKIPWYVKPWSLKIPPPKKTERFW